MNFSFRSTAAALRKASIRTNLGAPSLRSKGGKSTNLALAFSIAATLLSWPGTAQTPPPAPPRNTATEPAPTGTVIFSRSTDDSGKTTTTAGPAAEPAIQIAEQPAADDAERLAVSFSALDLDVHLQTAEHRIAVRAQVTVHNTGKTPLAHIPLQISSSLNWEQIRLAGHDVSFQVATLNSDTDHTGQLHEASVLLAKPLAPGDTLALDVVYSGVIVGTAQRLLTLGTPAALALHSDWDEISPDFTGLRGFGNVVWYPVASVPVILGDGSRLFDEIGRHKLSLEHTHFRLRITVEFPHGTPPTVALVNGFPVSLAVADAPGLDSDLAGIATAAFETPYLGFTAPSLFVAVRKAHPATGLTAFTAPDNDISVQSWIDEAAAVTPFVQGWLGHQPRSQLTLLDLPDPNDAPFETGALLATSLHAAPANEVDGVLAHTLTHAFLQSPTEPPPGWLNEGLATFIESLWVEKRSGRNRALEMLESSRPALALAEPSSPGQSSGEPLAVATAPVYYRTKAAYVFWMLRDMAGDEALSAALRAWISGHPAALPVGANTSAATALQTLLKQAGVSRDLGWFFTDWVETDKGLPDLSIDSVFPNAAQAGTYLVAVNITNAGHAAASVPVTVRSAKSEVTERVFVAARGRAVERLVVMGPPTEVQVNDGSVPETQASVHVTSINMTSPDQPASKTLPNPGSSSSADSPSPPQ